MSRTKKSKVLKRKTVIKPVAAEEEIVSEDVQDTDSEFETEVGYEDDELGERTVKELSSDSARFNRLSGSDDCSDESSCEDGVGDIESVENMDELDEKLQKQKDESNLDPTKFGLNDEKAKNIYCDNSELVEEIRKFQEENVATEKLGELIIKIGVHMTSMVRFWRYSISIKEELAQNAIMQMMRSVPKFNLKKKNSNKTPNAFGYMSMIAYRDMLHTLKKHFKQNKIRDAVADVYIGRLAEANSSDERIGMLRQTLERSEDFNKFLKNDKYPYQKKEVDMFALSKDEQKRRYKENLRRQSEEKKIVKRKRNAK